MSGTNQLTLGSGRTIDEGNEVTVLDPIIGQRRRYRFKRVEVNGDVTCWGPVETNGLTPNGQMRSFKPDQIDDVKHRKPRSRSLREVTETDETTTETTVVNATSTAPAYTVHADGKVTITGAAPWRDPSGMWHRSPDSTDTYVPSRNSAAGKVERALSQGGE